MLHQPGFPWNKKIPFPETLATTTSLVTLLGYVFFWNRFDSTNLPPPKSQKFLGNFGSLFKGWWCGYPTQEPHRTLLFVWSIVWRDETHKFMHGKSKQSTQLDCLDKASDLKPAVLLYKSFWLLFRVWIPIHPRSYSQPPAKSSYQKNDILLLCFSLCCVGQNGSAFLKKKTPFKTPRNLNFCFWDAWFFLESPGRPEFFGQKNWGLIKDF